ncbi:hypothetical protein DC498_17720 [Terrimonas sp.]|uniref:hypothetical protein n=1 Tax=Terrimonas sp. TaxID=1914338 RepID=UPI000D51F304|nr:hypothetical protein [Terrimonas sp.]PVD50811.1 hypothetical protein DC498_17720 [Terrimonas sp.]
MNKILSDTDTYQKMTSKNKASLPEELQEKVDEFYSTFNDEDMSEGIDNIILCSLCGVDIKGSGNSEEIYFFLRSVKELLNDLKTYKTIYEPRKIN